MTDGFKVAEVLSREHPDSYRFLASFPLEAEYIHEEKGRQRYFLNVDTTFKHCPVSGQLQQFRSGRCCCCFFYCF